MPPSESPYSSAALQNGHVSPLPTNDISLADAPSDNDSDLSDVKEAADPFITAPQVNGAHQDTFDDEDMSDAEDEDAEGEEDGDYDLEYPPVEQNGHDANQASSPSGSSVSLKRKASMDDSELIAQNPELYGLRRSVSVAACRVFKR